MVVMPGDFNNCMFDMSHQVWNSMPEFNLYNFEDVRGGGGGGGGNVYDEVNSLINSESGGFWSSTSGTYYYANQDEAFKKSCILIEANNQWGTTFYGDFNSAINNYDGGRLADEIRMNNPEFYLASNDGGGTKTISIKDLAPKQDFSGFWGGLKYLITGGIIDGYQYNIDGKVTGWAPITGMAPTPGFKGGNVFIKGFGMIEKELFHLTIKPGILKSAGNFSKIVGRNPDIVVKEGSIILRGTGPYSGKIYQTGLKALDFFGY